jgi:peptide/nickel transport system substrate-binding protein
MTRTRLLALLAVLALVVAACGGTGDETTTTAGDGGDDVTTTTSDDGTDTTAPAPTGGAGEGGPLLLLQWQGPSQINTYLSTGTKDIQAGSLVLEPLADYDPTGAVSPKLAAEIPSSENGAISEDLTQITWTLKEGVLWSDGTPLTADDVVFSWEYCTDEATGCQAAGNFDDVVSVEAVDDLTVTITFAAPKPYPFSVFVGATSPILQRAQFADCVGEAAVGCTEQNFQPVGTGPYVVTDMRPEDTVLYEMNPNYRGVEEGKPFFGTVEIKGGGDAESTARSVLEIGEADYAWNLQVAPEILEPMEAAGNGAVYVNFNSSVEAIRLNQTDHAADPPSEFQGDPRNPTGGTSPFFYQNPDFVRALSMAINRDELNAVGYGVTGEPTCTFWPVGEEATTTFDWCLTQDIEGANALLDELGYEDTDGDGTRELEDGTPLEFDYLTSTNAVRQSFQDLIAVYWEQIGVATNMSNEDAGLFFDGTCASDACIWKFFAPVQMYTNSSVGPDAVGYFADYQCEAIPTSANSWGGGNIERHCTEEFDSMYQELSATTLEDPARIDLIKALQDDVLATSVIPLVNRGSVSAFANDIQGVGDLNGWDTEYWNIQDWTRG